VLTQRAFPEVLFLQHFDENAQFQIDGAGSNRFAALGLLTLEIVQHDRFQLFVSEQPRELAKI
jgi:hypothetical protein